MTISGNDRSGYGYALMAYKTYMVQNNHLLKQNIITPIFQQIQSYLFIIVFVYNYTLNNYVKLTFLAIYVFLLQSRHAKWDQLIVGFGFKKQNDSSIAFVVY